MPPSCKSTPQDGARPLHLASVSGCTDAVQQLMAAGANVNASMKNGWTPLFLACRTGRADIVVLLLAAGAHKDVGTVVGLAPARFLNSYGQKLCAWASPSDQACASWGSGAGHTLCKADRQSLAEYFQYDWRGSSQCPWHRVKKVHNMLDNVWFIVLSTRLCLLCMSPTAVACFIQSKGSPPLLPAEQHDSAACSMHGIQCCMRQATTGCRRRPQDCITGKLGQLCSMLPKGPRTACLLPAACG